jgi:hypothetical protein
VLLECNRREKKTAGPTQAPEQIRKEITMMRKLLFGAMAAVGIGFGAQAANAGEPAFAPVGGAPVVFNPSHAGYDYIVLIQRHGCWERYGRFDTLHEARRAEWRLEREGFRVQIDEVRNHRW